MTSLTKRHFLATAVAAPFLLRPAFAANPITYAYSPGVIEDALRAGRTVVVEYHAFWCSVCRRQQRVFERLRTENIDYNRLYYVRVDWDEYRDFPVALDRDVFNRSTLLVLRGSEEIDRVVAATGVAKLREFLDGALNSS
ncbi:MAG: thioredoxin family protein [Pseudomonadota bacterium]